MNKYKVLETMLMISIVMGICASYKLALWSMASITKDTPTFIIYLSGLCVILFGSLASLALDKIETNE